MNLSEQVNQAQVKNILAKLKAGKTISRREQQQVEAFEAGKAQPISLRDKAKHFKISHVALLKWGKAGCPVEGSIEEIDAWRAQKTKEPTTSFSEAKLQKTLREIERLDIIVARERGELVSRVEVREAGVAVGALLSAECSAIVNDMPGQIAGQSEVEIRPKLQARIDLLLSNIRKKIDESVQ